MTISLAMAKEKNQELEVGVKREKDQRNGIRKKIKKETEVEIGTKKMKRIRTEENRYCLCSFLLIQNDYKLVVMGMHLDTWICYGIPCERILQLGGPYFRPARGM